MSQEKINLLNQYIEGYTPQNRIEFCKLALNKFRFEKYKLGNKHEFIATEDRIVNDTNTRQNIQNIIDKNECSIDDFKSVFNMLTIDQIHYIGY